MNQTFFWSGLVNVVPVKQIHRAFTDGKRLRRLTRGVSLAETHRGSGGDAE